MKKPSKSNETYSEGETLRRFKMAIRGALKMPPKKRISPKKQKPRRKPRAKV